MRVPRGIPKQKLPDLLGLVQNQAIPSSSTRKQLLTSKWYIGMCATCAPSIKISNVTPALRCRSQRDPLAADPDAPQHVLKTIEVGQNKKVHHNQVRFAEKDEGGLSEYQMMKRAALDALNEEVAAYARDDWELGEYNFPKDGYDYSKHLKEVSRLPRNITSLA